MTHETREPISMRIRPSDLAEIDRRASALHMTRTEYMVKAALRQPLGDGLEDRLDEHDQRLERLERMAELS